MKIIDLKITSKIFLQVPYLKEQHISSLLMFTVWKLMSAGRGRLYVINHS